MACHKPLVSIVIPVVNNLNYNKPCLESVFRHASADIPYEIVVVDNNSNDGSREYFLSLGDKIKLVANNVLRTFAQSCNQGAENASGQYLVFLNNDTYVTDGWLSAMLDCIRSDPKIGIVGNKQLFPKSQLVSHVGGVFNAEKRSEHIYVYFDPSLEFLNVDREYQWVTGCCLLISKPLFSEIEGFDEGYQNLFEDVDLCFKARNRGHKVFYCHKSVIYHYGYATPRPMKYKTNWERFDKRWRDQIKADEESYFRADNVPGCLGPKHLLESFLFERYYLKMEQRFLKEEQKLLNQERELLKQEQKFLKLEARNLQACLEAVYNTKSWKITKPLRWAQQRFLKKAAP